MRHFTVRGTPRGRRFKLVTSAQLAALLAAGELVPTRRFNSWEGIELHGGQPGPDPDPDPDTIDEELRRLTTHAALDAWVQAHEADLPCRPDEWATLTIAAKKAWVIENYEDADGDA
jgi:hypothetical protein